MSLPPDLLEMLSAFDASGVRYLVIGGHAVSLHARPRTTKDLDLWLDADRENIGRACAALLRFGVPEAIVDDLRTTRPDEIVWMGRIPARIDFLKTVPGVAFDAAWLGGSPPSSQVSPCSSSGGTTSSRTSGP